MIRCAIGRVLAFARGRVFAVLTGGCSLTLTGEIKNMDYKDLVVWQMGMRIAKDIYDIVIPKMPDSEKYAL